MSGEGPPLQELRFVRTFNPKFVFLSETRQSEDRGEEPKLALGTSKFLDSEKGRKRWWSSPFLG